MGIKIRKIKSTFILILLLCSIFLSIINPTSKADPVYNARVVLEVNWAFKDVEKPIVPRDEIKELDLLVVFKIETGETFGKGLLDSYRGSAFAIIDIYIIETSPWCSAVLQQNVVVTSISEYEEISTKLYIALDDNAPAFGNGFIKIRASCPKLGKIQGFEKVFELSFSPDYKSIIKLTLPEVNTMRINPTSKAVFPIEIENAGNDRTQVLFKIENVPEGWDATISDTVFLKEESGSKATAYLSIIPPNQFGYHYDEANIRVTITPVRASEPKSVGNSLFATFTIQNRGFSVNGIEQIILYLIIVVAIILIVFFILKRKFK